MRITIGLDDVEVRRGINRLQIAGDDLTPAMRAIANHIQRGVERRFQKGVGPSGTAWADLSDVTKERRKKAGRVPIKKLVRSGKLRDSFHSDFDARSAVVGTGVAYAATHQFGAARGEFGVFSVVAQTVRGRRRQVRRGKRGDRTQGRPIPWGDIPARPFFGFDDADRTTVLDDINRHLVRAFRGR